MPLSQFQPQNYNAVFQQKLARTLPAFASCFSGEATAVASAPQHYRMRAEFRMWHSGDKIDFVMFKAPGQPQVIEQFPVACRPISERMGKLKSLLEASDTLRQRLFQVEFLSTGNDDTLLSLIYHKKLDQHWREAALQLQQKLAVQVIGRSRKHKVVLGRDYVTEELEIGGRKFSYRQAEGVFTQPNAGVNRRMIEWALEQTAGCSGDLLELYCGIGNFTLPLATRFRRVLATEISKQAVACARANMAANGIDNITLLRMSSEDFTAAMDGVRPFRRLRDIDLQSFDLRTVLVDPPRAGLDPATLALVGRAPQIVYISCNPVTLLQNLEVLGQTHRVTALAFFDQFPYTPHLECGIILARDPEHN
jgi:tRNA (uracil-5-)-methyltransferase